MKSSASGLGFPMVKRLISWFNENAQGILTCLLLVLFTVFIAVMFSQVIEDRVDQFVGLSEESGSKNAILTFLGLSMGGVLLALQAVIANIRAKAMENAAKEQANANEHVEQGQRQERLKNAIEHLGHDAVSVCLGGAYELFHLAHDTEEKNQRQSILDILCAHIRQTTSDKKYRKDYKSEPSEEIQSLLTLLFVQEHDVFKGLHINLQRSWLNGAELRKARLHNANIAGAYLKSAWFYDVRLQGADLFKAMLQEAKLEGAQMQGAKLWKAQLQGAYLQWTKLQGADLYQAQFQGANLLEAQL